MRAVKIIDFAHFWKGNGRHGVRFTFDNAPPDNYFISDKQYKNLQYRNAFALLDGDRFVWSAGYDDIDGVLLHFGASLQEYDPHLEQLNHPVAIEHDELKN